MKKNLLDYIKVYNVIPKQICEQTILELTDPNIHWETNQFYNPTNGNLESRTTTKEIDTTFDKLTTTPVIMKCIWNSIDTYINKDLAFPWNNNWNGFTNIRYHKYETNQKFVNHCDHIQSLFDGQRKGIPTLSVVALFNDNFKGGEFVMLEDEVIDLKQGDLLIFPSIFLFPHEVLEIKEGKRYSGAAWVW